jgi:hypothetical protein|tara:strand:+ start:230 stop:598 length:369 start_codon:yes stop_codon:yes gene_type:complete
MKALKNENLEDLKQKVYDLITKTSIEIGHRTDAKTLASLSNIFAQDLIQEKRFGNMTFNQIVDGFRLGVRFGKDDPFINIRTFYKWTYAQKQLIDNAEYEVRTLGKDPKFVLHYQEPIKLLK